MTCCAGESVTNAREVLRLDLLGLLELVWGESEHLRLRVVGQTLVLAGTEDGFRDPRLHLRIDELRCESGQVLLDRKFHLADRNAGLVVRHLRDDALEELEHVLAAEEFDVELGERIGLRELLGQLRRLDEALGVVGIAYAEGHQEDFLEELDERRVVLGVDELLGVGVEALAGTHLEVQNLRLAQVEPEVLGDLIALEVFVSDGFLDQGIAFLEK